MTTTRDPLDIRHLEPLDGLAMTSQRPPPTAASASITFLSPAGCGRDPRGSEGAALLTTQSMTAAAGPWKRVELARRLDRLGASLHYQVAPESTEISISGPADEWPALLELLATVVLTPRFEPDDLARVVRQMRERQLRDLTQPGARAERELLRAIYPRGHPYRETGSGSAESLRRLTRGAVRRFHRNHFVADGSRIVTTVPAPDSRVRAEVERRLRSLDRSTRIAPLHLAAPSGSTGTTRVPMVGRSQVELRLGGPSLPRSAPEFPALFLAHEVLGGRPLLSRLFQRVREKEGLAYHASSALEAMRYGGYWSVAAGASSEHWARALELLREELARIQDEAPRPVDLRRVRESAIGELPLSLETTSDAHELAVDVAYHELPGDFWRRWPGVLRAVRPDSVRQAAEVGLDRRTAATVVAGPIVRG